MKTTFAILAALVSAQAVAASDEDWMAHVAVLKANDIENWKEEKTPALVMFHAPWCGHCKAFKPFFGKVAALVKEHELAFGLGGVDCTADDSKALCAPDRYNVSSYPSTLFFADKDAAPVNYESSRTTKGLKKFIRDKLGLQKFPGNEAFVNEQKWEENGNVVHQTEDHFESFRKEHPRMLVMFYAPWCGHCKTFKPAFAEASRKIKAAPLVAVDCTEEADVCQKYGANSYPTLTWFSSPEGDGVPYDGSRDDANDVRSWVENKVEAEARQQIGSKPLEEKDLRKLRVRVLRKMLKERGLECKGCTDKKEFVKLVLDNQNVVVKAMPKKHKMTWAEERREKKARAVAEQGWEAAPDVVHLTDFTWETFRAKQEKPMMVMFYAPWCGHCKAIKPKYAESATHVKGLGVVVAVDCDTNPTTCQKYKANSFPTLKTFTDSKADSRNFDGGRDVHDFVEFFSSTLAKPLRARAKRMEAACTEAGICMPK